MDDERLMSVGDVFWLGSIYFSALTLLVGWHKGCQLLISLIQDAYIRYLNTSGLCHIL